MHAATLLTGEHAVAKIQRTTTASLLHEDLKVMPWLATHLFGRIPIAALANPPVRVELFAETEEPDFRMETANIRDMATTLHDLGQEQHSLPRGLLSLVACLVLVMERVELQLGRRDRTTGRRHRHPRAWSARRRSRSWRTPSSRTSSTSTAAN